MSTNSIEHSTWRFVSLKYSVSFIPVKCYPVHIVDVEQSHPITDFKDDSAYVTTFTPPLTS